MEMEITSLQFVPYIPAEYIYKNINPNWTDLNWAFSRQAIGQKILVDIAKLKENKNSFETELSNVDKDHFWKVEELLEKLVAQEKNQDQNLSKRKWLYVILKYIYEHKEKFADPLEKVEEIYADFYYPPDIKKFVRYMSVDESENYNPLKHTDEENLKRMYHEWGGYLKTESKIYA